jgi:hypothetical protein
MANIGLLWEMFPAKLSGFPAGKLQWADFFWTNWLPAHFFPQKKPPGRGRLMGH